MKTRNAFTMIELVFAIVVIGILSKFGIEFLSQAYRSFIYTNINHKLQSESQGAVDIIASKLQYRIKDSVIARHGTTDFYPIGQLNQAQIDNYDTLEWIGEDAEGLRGIQAPYWNGVIDLDDSDDILLVSPFINTTSIKENIVALSDNNSSLDNAALYFVGANSEITQMGWQGKHTDTFSNTTTNYITAISDQSQTIHPISAGVNGFAPRGGNFSGERVSEYYKLAWSAYAIRLEDYNTTSSMGDLYLYYNYQPWDGEYIPLVWDEKKSYPVKRTLLANNISTFRFISMGSLLKIQVCVKSNLLKNEEHSICKDKTVF